MARRNRRKDDALLNDLFAALLVLPWWGGPLFAGIAYLLFAVVLPSLLTAAAAASPVAAVASDVFSSVSVGTAPWVSLLILFMGVVALVKRQVNRQLFDAETGAENFRNLSWSDFERLLAEAYRRKNYQVEHVGGNGPDGGVDLRLHRGGATTLVQCKHWRDRKVGVKVVRELMGVVTSQGADSGIVVTSGAFTREAEDFANTCAIRLVDGSVLSELIREVQANSNTRTTPPAVVLAPPTPLCPQCRCVMVLRTARKGANAGSRFWGCSNFPRCKGIVNIEV